MAQNQNASARLAKNTVIYMIGNLGSKILQVLILPLLTAVLLTEEYGYYDLIVTTINLITPIATLQLVEAMFRYLFGGSEEEKRVTISSVTAALVVGMTILAAVIALIQMFGIDLKYPFLIYLNYITNILFDYMQKIARCQQRNSLVAVSGVINTSVMLAVEAMALLVFKMRVDGMLLANCVSYFVAVLYLEYKLRIEEYLSIAAVNVKRVKELLKYSLPLVPNSVCWWVVSACDRYVISFFLSISANGIYSIAGKFSQMLSMITSVFQMAWQESSIIESDKATRDEFYTKTFDSYMRFLLSGYVVLLPIIRLAMPFLVAEEYRIGYLYNPLLLLGAVFSAFSQFYGSAYLAFKKTGGALSTTIIAAIINVTVGACLISKIGLYAPALGTTCAFLAQWLLRANQMKDYFRVKINTKVLSFMAPTMIVYYALYYKDSVVLHLTMLLVASIVFCTVNREMIRKILATVKKKVKSQQY
jgi:polysaccharide biosynthesis protein